MNELILADQLREMAGREIDTDVEIVYQIVEKRLDMMDLLEALAKNDPNDDMVEDMRRFIRFIGRMATKVTELSAKLDKIRAGE